MKGPVVPPKREVHDTAPKRETINSKDIVEADFEELTDEKEKTE